GKDGDDIISKKSLEVVKDVISLLKQHSREEGLFRRSGRQILRQQILQSLKKGEKLQVPNSPDTAKECAAALQLYLAQLKSPVIPTRVQQLLLADNPGITAHTIARDALGIIRQDVMGRHSELLVDLLGLLNHLLLCSPASERTELQAPTLVSTFLPVFFNLASDDVTKWRQVAARLNELVMEAPKHLYKMKNSCATDLELSSETNAFVRLRELSLFYPIVRLVENNRNNCTLISNLGKRELWLVRCVDRWLEDFTLLS
ncbi:hypothetical protein TSAR_009270, partial [Trichomalopsis sarcophagae]